MYKQVLYFGQPVNNFGTELEKDLLVIIKKRFPGYNIENPNSPKHQREYEEYKKKHGNGILYYTEVVLPACHGGIFLPFGDGTWGAGVFTEAQYFWNKHLPVWCIVPDGRIMEVRNLTGVRVLSVDETMARIRDVDGNPIPYR